MNNENDTTNKAAGILTNLLTGWGLPGSIARIISGAILGALAAAYALTGSGCTAAYNQNAAGDISYTGSIILPAEETK